MLRALLATLLALVVLAPAAADAKVIRSGHYHEAFYTDRLSTVIGFIPVAGIQPDRKPRDVRVGRNVYRGVWKSFLVSRKTTSEALRYMLRDGRRRYGNYYAGLFADRPLTAREKRSFKVIADIARDADVLAVAKGHPACESGLTMKQARDIAAGRVKRWSEVGVAVAEDTIRLGFTGELGRFERRFGVMRAPAGAKRSFDAGLRAAGDGDRAVAVVTSWSRVGQTTAVCKVPLGGVAPTDVSVHALQYAGAYAMTYVVNRRPLRDAYDRAKRRAFVKFLLSEFAGKLWKNNGLLLASEKPAPPAPTPPPATGSPSPSPSPSHDGQVAPTHDAQGRPITASRDDDGVRAALAGERFQFTHSTATERYALESADVLHLLTITNEGQCSQLDGTWQLLSGWRYSEHGGGTIARVHLSAPGMSGDVVIELPGDAPATAYWDGQPYERSRELAGTC